MSLLDTILGTLAPHDCLGCGAEGSLLCPACSDALPPARLSDLSIPELQHIGVATTYQGVAKELLWRLKSSGAQAAASVMARHMTPLAVASARDAILVPLPTATTRVRQRGYDQARLLARELSRQTGLPCCGWLVRHGQAHQVGASRQQRVAQVQDAFRLRQPHVVAGAHIILVDDVITTGATLSVAAQILKSAGARQVDALAFAHPN